MMEHHPDSPGRLTDEDASPSLSRAITVLSVSYILATLAVLPFSRIPGPVVPAVTTTFGAGILLADLCTGLLLLGQFRVAPSWSMLLLAAAYFYGAVMALLHILTFPGAWVPGAVLFGTPESVGWLFIFWMLGYPTLVLAAVAAEAGFRHRRIAASRITQAVAAMFGGVLAVTAALTLVATTGPSWLLPGVLHGDAFTSSSVAAQWTSVGIAMCAFVALRLVNGGRTVLYRWLGLALVAFIGFNALAASGGARYTMGWILSRVSGFISANLLLVFFLGRFAKLHRSLVTAFDRVRDANDNLERRVADRTAALTQANADLQHEIADRRQAEMARRESEQRFRVLADAAPVLIWMSGTDKLCTWFNQQWLAFVGRTMEQELGNGWAENVHPDDLDRCVKTYVTSFDACQSFAMEYRLRRHDGEYCWVLDNGIPLHSTSGEFTGYIGSCIDITDMRESSAALAAEIETTRAFFDAAAEGIVIVSQTEQIVNINARGAEMFGYAHEELVGQPIELLLPERFRAAHRDHRTSYFDAPRTRSMGLGLDLFGRRRDGSDFPIEISLSPIDTAAGSLAMALVTDVSERRSLERAARQHEKLAALATLSAGIAHELNNPIGIISTRIEVMLQDAESQPLSPEVIEDLHVLHRNIQRVIRIAKGLLSFARQTPEQRRPVVMNTVVEETLLLVGKQLATDGVRVAVELDPNLGAIWGDSDALQQLVVNLVLNARDAMPRGGDLRIETAADPMRAGWVRLTVADSGDGMPPETVERIWEPFYTTKPSGTGLGLSVSHRIIREHKGVVEVQSEPGRGTTFIIRLPLHS